MLRRRKIVLGVLLLIILTMSLLSAQSRKSKVFFVNCYSTKVDVRLGDEENPVFIFTELEAFSSTTLQITKELGTYTLWFKLSSEKDWYYWADDDKNAYNCDVEAGKTQCIIAGVDGTMHYFTITEDLRGGSHITFLNGADDKVSLMEIAKDFNDDSTVASYIEDLNPNEISNFGTIDPDTYHLYWQFPKQKKAGTHFYYPDDSGKKAENFFFKKNSYYLFLAYTQGRTDYAVLYNITPTK